MVDSNKPVNYDRIATTYNDRYRVNWLAGIERGLLSFARNLKARRVLDVGCGTGRWLNSISTVADGIFGLDLSSGMLAQAHKDNPNLLLTQGRAGSLPFVDQSFDLVYCINALHHFEEPQDFISETWSLLKPGGCLGIIGQIPQDKRNRWYVYDYFEGTYEADLMRFQPWDTVMGWMDLIGYKEIQWNPVETIIDHKFGRDVLKDPFIKKNAVSQLAILSDQAYMRGIERIWEAIKEAEAVGDNLIFQTELRLDMLTGTKNRPPHQG